MEEKYTNSIGMEMQLIKPSSFYMGDTISGELDEMTVHKVSITKPFFMGFTQVTNAQYEQFDPSHKALRGKNEFSFGDDEPVIFVSWNDAKAFCNWLSEIEGKLAQSISRDMGRTCEYMASEFSPIGSGQRLILKRLNEGPLILISFTDSANHKFYPDSGETKPKGITAKNALGEEELVYGMFAALSYDEGKTWPVKKLISSGDRKSYSGGAWTGDFYMDENHAEPMGYLAATQSPDNIIHLVSSRLYYKFNLLWLEDKK